MYAVSAAGFLAVVVLFYMPSPPAKFRAEYDSGRIPGQSVGCHPRGGLSRSVFTHDEWGDYLIYRLYPKHKSLRRRQVRFLR